MKKVSFCVELYNEKGEIQYAYLYIGVMTRRHVYARAISDGSADKQYICVNRKETKDISEYVRSVHKHLYDQDRSISVSDKVGLDDPRIMPIKKDMRLSGIMEALEKFYQEYIEEEKEWMKKLSS